MSNQKPVIGHDPLAWMQKDAEEAHESTEISVPVEAADESVEADAEGDVQAAAEAVGAVQEAAEDGPVLLPESLTIAEAAAIKASFIAGLDKSESLVIDASRVEMVDTAGIQLLVALSKDAAARSLEIDWQDPSEPLCRTVSLLGLQASLGFPGA